MLKICKLNKSKSYYNYKNSYVLNLIGFLTTLPDLVLTCTSTTRSWEYGAFKTFSCLLMVLEGFTTGVFGSNQLINQIIY